MLTFGETATIQHVISTHRVPCPVDKLPVISNVQEPSVGNDRGDKPFGHIAGQPLRTQEPHGNFLSHLSFNLRRDDESREQTAREIEPSTLCTGYFTARTLKFYLLISGYFAKLSPRDTRRNALVHWHSLPCEVPVT